MMHYNFMGHQSYVLLCSKMASFRPSGQEHSHVQNQYIPGKQVLVRS